MSDCKHLHLDKLAADSPANGLHVGPEKAYYCHDCGSTFFVNLEPAMIKVSYGTRLAQREEAPKPPAQPRMMCGPDALGNGNDHFGYHRENDFCKQRGCAVQPYPLPHHSKCIQPEELEARERELREKLEGLAIKFETPVASSRQELEAVYRHCAEDLRALLAQQRGQP